MEKADIEKKIAELEAMMGRADFWNDKESAQQVVREYQELKGAAEGKEKHDESDAIVTIFSGAGGLDAEDFARMLSRMYLAFFCAQKLDAYDTPPERKRSRGRAQHHL
jgi:peptide chain release factor 2